MLTALARVGDYAAKLFASDRPISNVYGLCRSIIALSTLLTLLGNTSDTLFVKLTYGFDIPQCRGVGAAGLFCAMPTHLDLGRMLAIAILLVVVSGWRPRITGALHLWVAMSVALNTTLTDGGDQICYALSLILFPVTLCDSRKWHWDAAIEPSHPAMKTLASSAIVLARLQMAGLYFHAAAGKYATAEWNNGTALYYILNEPVYGAPSWQRALLRPILTHDTGAIITWSVIVLEFVLAASFFARRKYWAPLLAMGIALHVGIAMTQGIVSFSTAMCGGLVILLRPTESELVFARTKRLIAFVRERAAREAPVRGGLTPLR
jgi:antimicrobial peptide system SdpB family protein